MALIVQTSTPQSINLLHINVHDIQTLEIDSYFEFKLFYLLRPLSRLIFFLFFRKCLIVFSEYDDRTHAKMKRKQQLFRSQEKVR